MTRSRKVRSFVLAYDVPYPGDFYMTDRWWRAVKEVEGESASEVVKRCIFSLRLSVDCSVVVATSYLPAFDVVRSREIAKPAS